MSTDETATQEDSSPEQTQNWPELVAGVYDRIREEGDDGISVQFRDMEIQVPGRTGEDADHAYWTIDGTIELNPDE